MEYAKNLSMESAGKLAIISMIEVKSNHAINIKHSEVVLMGINVISVMILKYVKTLLNRDVQKANIASLDMCIKVAQILIWVSA